jgi:hypothetical protein
VIQAGAAGRGQPGGASSLRGVRLPGESRLSVAGGTLWVVRPALKAGLLPVWRDRETVQIGIDPRRAVALTGMSGAAPVLSLLDGSRDREQVIAAACEQGIPEPVTDRILTLLAVAGALDDFPAAAIQSLGSARRQRLRAELAAAALAREHSDAGATVLVRRDAASVRVFGPGRVATAIADILATSGVGRVAISDVVRRPSPAAARNVGPRRGRSVAGPDVAQLDRAAAETRQPSTQAAGAGRTSGRRPGVGLADIAQAGPGHAGAGQAGQATAGPGGGLDLGGGRNRRGRGRAGVPVPDLAVVTGRAGPGLRAWLMQAQVPHLVAAAEEAIGVVGPLVRPGQTACLRCLDITRASLDPAWPLILAQLAGRTAEPPACDAALAAAVAAQAAAQALAFLDRAPEPGPAENGTLELVLPAWQWRRRSWPQHAACGCRADPAA